MTIDSIDKIHSFKDKHKLIKTLIYIKLSEIDISLPENDLNVLALFGLSSDKDVVIQWALDKEYVRSWQSCENKVSTMVKMKLLEKSDLKKRKISNDIFQGSKNDYIYAKLRIHNVQS